ncbi:MAG: hypothetical protein ACI4XM_03910 [Candidatus Coprovivens sp.]
MVNLLELEEKRKRQEEESERIRNADPLGIKKELKKDPVTRIMNRFVQGEKRTGLTGGFLMQGLLGTSGIVDVNGNADIHKMLNGLYDCYSEENDKDIPIIFENALIKLCEHVKEYTLIDTVVSILEVQLKNEIIGYSPYRVNPKRILIELKKQIELNRESIEQSLPNFEQWIQEKDRELGSFGHHF